jgi:hypothetical protein
LRPAWANSSRDPISKITRPKWTQDVEHLLYKCEALSSNSTPTKKKKKEREREKKKPKPGMDLASNQRKSR